MVEHERELDGTKLGTCPYCESPNYARNSLKSTDDIVFTDCECDCGKTFKETFVLKFQQWTDDKEGNEIQ